MMKAMKAVELEWLDQFFSSDYLYYGMLSIIRMKQGTVQEIFIILWQLILPCSHNFIA